MIAHELLARLAPESEDYKACMAAVKFDLGGHADATHAPGILGAVSDPGQTIKHLTPV